jgi:hypothetical protein
MTRECNGYQKQIPQLLLGDLDKEAQQELQRHLEECSRCRAEHKSYSQTVDLLKSFEDDPVPHHFFVYPDERKFNFWKLFRHMRPRWQAVTAAAFAMMFLLGIAAISRLHTQFGQSGWVVDFGGSQIDVAALKNDILREIDEKNKEARTVWLDEVREEIASSISSLTQDQQAELEAALSRLDAKISRKIQLAEDNATTDAENLAVDIYWAISKQRAQDLSVINLRFDSIEASDIIKTRQTNAILGTLLQEASLRIR